MRKILGAIIIGVLGVTLIAVAFGLEPWHGFVARPPSLAPTFLKMNLAGALNLSLIVIVLTLLLVTILDTAGTLIGVARQAEMLDSEGRLPRLRQALLADSGAAMLGAALGTWTTTAYIESAAGMEEGGRRPQLRSSLPLFSAQSFSRAARPDRAALRHCSGAHLRRLPNGC